ncbi:F-box protein [Glycine soja]|nr:F-box protein [Glycine soja]
MSFRWENENPNPNSPLKKRWSLNQMVMAMKLQSLSCSPGITDKSNPILSPFPLPITDRTLLLSDELLLKIIALVSDSSTQRNSNSLVCKRWLNLQGRLVRSLRISDWNFLLSGRLIHRFPNLNHVDLLSAALISPKYSDVLLTNRVISMHLSSDSFPYWCFCEDNMLPFQVIDNGLTSLASGCPNSAPPRSASSPLPRSAPLCRYSNCSAAATTFSAGSPRGCKRLVKLELSGCEGSFDGIKAIGKCCQMLEELTFSDHRMGDGWLAAISFCENLKTLRFQSCKRIDPNPGMEEYLGCCPALDRLHLQKCQLRDKKSVAALFSVCRVVREIVIQDCWGLDNSIFSFAMICRRVKLLYVEGCSLLTTEGLECVIHSWKELQSLRVVTCKNIKDSEISPALATLFTTLKELRWSPDTKSLLPSGVMGKKGDKFFKRAR